MEDVVLGDQGLMMRAVTCLCLGLIEGCANGFDVCLIYLKMLCWAIKGCDHRLDVCSMLGMMWC